jgi:hypothetical protein
MSEPRLVKWLIGVVLLLVILLTPLWLLVPDGGARLVQNGLRSFEICGKARTEGDPLANPLASDIMSATPGSRVGTWSIEWKADCTVYYHSVWGSD